MWRERSVTEVRPGFVARLLEGEGISEVCRISAFPAKPAAKSSIATRRRGSALCDRLRRPVRYANQLRDRVVRLIVDLKRDKPHWADAKSGNCWSASWPATCA